MLSGDAPETWTPCFTVKACAGWTGRRRGSLGPGIQSQCGAASRSTRAPNHSTAHSTPKTRGPDPDTHTGKGAGGRRPSRLPEGCTQTPAWGWGCEKVLAVRSGTCPEEIMEKAHRHLPWRVPHNMVYNRRARKQPKRGLTATTLVGCSESCVNRKTYSSRYLR